MKNILKSFWILILCVFTFNVNAQLRSIPAIPVEKGRILKTAILADPTGQVFLEFIKGDRVATDNKDIKVYEGEILPPTIVDAPAKAPRARMRELLSFEIISNTGDNLFLIDQYAALNAHTRKRLSYQDSEKLSARQSGIQILTKIFTEDKIGRPAIWFYDLEKTKWFRLGGITTESSERKIKVFSGIIYQSGTFTIWDENPGPDFNPEAITNPEDVELAEVSPYPSVENSAETVGSVDEDFNYDTFNGDYKNSAGGRSNSDDEFGQNGSRNGSYRFKNDEEFGDLPKNVDKRAFQEDGAFINGSSGQVQNDKDRLTREEYETKYGADGSVDSEEKGFNVFDNFYNTFDKYLGEDDGGNPKSIPSLDNGRSVNNGGVIKNNKFDDQYGFDDKKNINQKISEKKYPENKNNNFGYKPNEKQNKSGFSDADFKNAAPLLQTNLFDSDLSKTGPDGFNFPWYILGLILIFGGSIYIAFSKKY